MSLIRIRHFLEQYQIVLYLVAICMGTGLSALGLDSSYAEAAIEPALAFMLFVTFLQVPLRELGQSLRAHRFLSTLLLCNFILIPLLVWGLLPLLPTEPVLLTGALLVLLTPCIDYVVTFAHLGRADARALLASTPLLLGLQIVLLPLYLHFFLGPAVVAQLPLAPFLRAFLWFIAVPLLLAALCQYVAHRYQQAQRLTDYLGALPVPATACVLFLVLASTLAQLQVALDLSLSLIPAYLLFALLAPALSWLFARCCALPSSQARAVAFSGATRNSLVVLPIGLAIPNALPGIAVVIVTQTLIELLSELLYIRVMPRLHTRAE